MTKFWQIFKIEITTSLISYKGMINILAGLLLPIIMMGTQYWGMSSTQAMLSVFSMGVLYSIITRIQIKIAEKGQIYSNRATFILYNKYAIVGARLLTETLLFLVIELVSFGFGLVMLSTKSAINIDWLLIAKQLPFIIISTTSLYILACITGLFVVAKMKNEQIAKIVSMVISLLIILPSMVSTFIIIFLPAMKLWVMNNNLLVTLTPILNIMTPGIMPFFGDHIYYSLFSSIEFIIMILIIFRYYALAEKEYLTSM